MRLCGTGRLTVLTDLRRGFDQALVSPGESETSEIVEPNPSAFVSVAMAGYPFKV